MAGDGNLAGMSGGFVKRPRIHASQCTTPLNGLRSEQGIAIPAFSYQSV